MTLHRMSRSVEWRRQSSASHRGQTAFAGALADTQRKDVNRGKRALDAGTNIEIRVLWTQSLGKCHTNFGVNVKINDVCGTNTIYGSPAWRNKYSGPCFAPFFAISSSSSASPSTTVHAHSPNGFTLSSAPSSSSSRSVHLPATSGLPPGHHALPTTPLLAVNRS